MMNYKKTHWFPLKYFPVYMQATHIWSAEQKYGAYLEKT